jgi:DNA (cytosine-5)-methyltransferase 1
MIRVGSLCSGYGGLDLAAEAAAGLHVEHAFVAETDAAAVRVLATHHPQTPNLGDITAVDWTRVPPVDILTAGWPCQPWSLAGQRKGAADERAIWPAVADAVRDLRPRYVFLENVPAIASAGELARAVGDLAALRYDAQWRCVRASDVGAPHKRERIFILAEPADANGGRRGADLADVRAGQPDACGRDAAAVLLKTPTSQLAINGGSQHPDKRKAGGHGPTLADEVEHLLPTPTAKHDARNATANRTAPKPTNQTNGWTLCDVAYAEPGRNGPRLAAPFVEWLMGLPAGWVTDLVGRNDALRLLGNGVVVQQGAYAYQLLAALDARSES